MAAIDGIKHVVVLMLENRSFDSMLGMLYPSSDGFDGLTGTEQKAIEEFYEQVGGTPQKIATKFISTLRASGNAFHTTAKGKSPWVDSYMAAADEVTVYWDMPSVT